MSLKKLPRFQKKYLVLVQTHHFLDIILVEVIINWDHTEINQDLFHYFHSRSPVSNFSGE